MCGLTGVFTRRALGPLTSSLEPMVGAIVHRGPDDSGLWADDRAGIGFGFRRLSILDLSPEGHQPMASPSGRFTMVFNGEIYNYRELRRELERNGVRFRGRSDTEVTLAAIERHGVEAILPRLNGMFAMAIWDSTERRLHLARDPIGIKPLFVHASDGWVTFGSELKAMQAAPVFNRAIDPSALSSYLRYLWIPAPRSIFATVRKLPPGHLLTIEDPERPLPESRPFWSLENVIAEGMHTPFVGADSDAEDQLDFLLRDAMRLQMQSDVPLGALLSGGIDSSTVVALMQAQSSSPINTFTIGFDVPDFDESAHAAKVARHLGTNHTELMVTGREALEVVPKLSWMFDEPFADPSQIPTYLVCALARRDVTVALSGDGGDEVFSGYNRYVTGERFAQRMQSIPRSLRRWIGKGAACLSEERIAAILGAFPGTRRSFMADKALKMARMMQAHDLPDVYRVLLGVCDSPETLIRSRSAGRDSVGEEIMHRPPDGLLERMMRSDQAFYLPDDLLAKTDRTSMAVSLEVRVPLLDTRVVAFGWSLPRALRVRDGRGKWILRKVLHRYVPPELVERPKMGFSVPIADWLAGPLRPWADDLVETAKGADELVGREVVKRWDSLRAAPRSRTGALSMWAILMYLAWRQAWLAA
jgi:asparagine synthase (glutamine-hydrolysing)